MHRRKTLSGKGTAALIVAALALASTPASAAIIPVTTTIDEADGSCVDSDCSLRDAVAVAVDGDVINIPSGNYVLTLGAIDFHVRLSLRGSGARTTVIDGNGSGIFRCDVSGFVSITTMSLVNSRGESSIVATGTGPNAILALALMTFAGNGNVADSGTKGGGVSAFNLSRVSIQRSTFSNNAAGEGGGLYAENTSAVSILNSTFFGNVATQGGSAIEVVNASPSGLVMDFVTLTANTSSPALEASNSVLSFTNNIVAGNPGGSCSFAATLGFTSRNNLAGDSSCGFTDPGSLTGVDPLLGPLANNGGDTDTVALLAGSPAIDAGFDVFDPPFDQRGALRRQGAHVDMGAYEAEFINAPPDCSGAAPSVARIWPPNHKMVPVSIQGVTDPQGGPVSIQISQVYQDEPTNSSGDGNTCPDTQGLDAATASVRAERNGQGNGRVYTLSFTATDEQGATCQGSVKVCVPHSSQGNCVDNGPLFDSTVCSGGSALSTRPSGHSHKSISSGLSLPCGSHFPTLECDLECDAGVLICQ